MMVWLQTVRIGECLPVILPMLTMTVILTWEAFPSDVVPEFMCILTTWMVHGHKALVSSAEIPTCVLFSGILTTTGMLIS